MTNEEARQSILVYCVEGCGKLDSCRAECDTCIEALAIQALEKQIPKKPVHDNIYKCQICGGIIGANNSCVDYCYRCGQKIDWSED